MKLFQRKRVPEDGQRPAEILRGKLAEVGASQADLAGAMGTSASRLTQLLNQLDITDSRKRAICRGLMVLAWERGWADEAVWALNEHSLLGMEPQLDRERVLGEIRERAEARKKAVAA